MNFKLGEEQVRCLNSIKEFIKSNELAFSITGSGGTGKTVLTIEIIKYLESIRKDYRLCAPTHKAKCVIEHYTNRQALTLHKLLSLSPKLDIINLDFNDLKFKMGNINDFPINGVIICDESSMISDDLFYTLTNICKTNGAKIIFLGDKCQLSPVDSTRVSKVYNLSNKFNLTKIYRQSSENAIFPILQDLREHKINHFTNCTGTDGSVVCESNFKKFFNLCKLGIEKAIKNEDIFEAKVLAYTNSRVNNYNNFLTKAIFGDSEEYYKLEILTGYENINFNGYDFWNSMDYIIVGEPKKIDIYIPEFCTLPGYQINLYDVGSKTTAPIEIISKNLNKEIYFKLAEHIDGIRLEAIESKGKYKSICWRRYYSTLGSFTSPADLIYNNRLIRKKSFDRGYAITVHKSQGSSINNVYIDMQDIKKAKLDNTLRQLQYVAMSRTRHNAYIFQ